jgi:hypothetical protein
MKVSLTSLINQYFKIQRLIKSLNYIRLEMLATNAYKQLFHAITLNVKK